MPKKKELEEFKLSNPVGEIYKNLYTNSMSCGPDGVMIIHDRKKLIAIQVDEIINHISREDLLKLSVFKEVLWHKINARHKRCDLTRFYWNPLTKVMFIGFEGIKFKSKRFIKDVPRTILPKGWRVVIRNVWDDKCAYNYFTHDEIEWESREMSNMEKIACTPLEYCLHNKVDYHEFFCRKPDALVAKILGLNS